MITTKSQREIQLMREAGRIVALAHQTVASMIAPGVTTKEINDAVERVIIENNATPSFKGYGGFPYAVCASVNKTLVHGFPNHKPLVEGDIVSIDIGANYKGYHGDSAWTYPVGEISDEAKKLLEVTKNSLFVGLSKIQPGVHLGDVSYAIGEYVTSFGFSLPIEYSGHGIGSSLHEDPSIPNIGTRGTGPILRSGMTLAIEPMVHVGKPQTITLMDGWTVNTKDGSLSAHFEHTVVVSDNGYEILTTL